MCSAQPWPAPVISSLLVALLSLIATPRAALADQKQQCADAYHAAQELKLSGELTLARDKLIFCAGESCPDAVRDSCAKWLNEVKDALPTIVVAAKGPAGEDLVDVRVFVDGELLTERLDGRAAAIDPGAHRLRFERLDGQSPPVERQLVIREGIKNRTVELRFDAPESPEPITPIATPDRAAPIGAYVVGAVGLAALGVFTGLAVAGTGEVTDLRDSCGQTHSCSDAEIDSARNKLIVADVFLYSGIACLGVGIGWLVYHYASEPAADTGLQFDVHPTPGGAAGVARWSF
jgi:hypothetical protein